MPPTPQHSQALVVGVWKYLHVKSLSENEDAIGVRDVLTHRKYCAYPDENVELLENEQATRANILAAVARLCAASTPDSRTFFYFSGHGGTDQGGSYLIPVDARIGQLETTAISAKLLAEKLRDCQGEVTVVLDCCYAAGLAPNVAIPPLENATSTGLGPFNVVSMRGALMAQNRVVLAASRSDDFAYGAGNAPFGLFTGHMLAGLYGKASANGEDVGVHHLFNYVQKQVVTTTQKAQRPMFIAATDSFYPLTRYPERITPTPIFDKDVYISYDVSDPHLRRWVAKHLMEDLEKAGLTVWGDQLGESALPQRAIVSSKYVVMLLTEEHARKSETELESTMAILQAVDTRTPRFIPIHREKIQVPLAIRSFVGLDMTDANIMDHAYQKKRLIDRLKKDPHVR